MLLKLLRPVILCLGIVLPNSTPTDKVDMTLCIESCTERLEQILEEKFGEGFLEDLRNGNIEIIE